MSLIIPQAGTLTLLAIGQRFKRRMGLWLSLLGGLATLLILDRCFPPPPPPAYATLVLAQDGSVLHSFLSPDDKWRLYTELTEITPAVERALLAKEDNYFYYHPGINPLAIARAAWVNLLAGRRTSGASTLTLQVVRLLEPRPRTYGAKIVEALRALQLEVRYSKRQLLQLYLNLAPYGSNLEGIKAASLRYFGRLPEALSLAQVTTLVLLPNRPTSLAPGHNNAQLLAARNRWLQRFAAKKIFPEPALQAALAEPLGVGLHSFPNQAPQLALRLHARYPARPLLHTTLQARTQARSQQLLTAYVARLQARGITNAAALVLNRSTRTVAAYVGSADFADPAAQGQVDGVRAVRSPGSTLKPLLYALALDQGLLTPRTVLMDVPTTFAGGYAPENYSRHSSGPVTVESALANSLNVPAVRTLQQLGISPLVKALQEAGFTQVHKDAPKLGLSLILGGCGVRLDELVGLYAAFANQGRWAPFNWLTTEHDTASFSLISPAAAAVTTHMLTQLTRPDLPRDFASSAHLPRVAWKTGTSYGRRDAWAVGYSGHYVIGVWLGNFTGEGNPDLAGGDIATPLLFQLFTALDDGTTPWPAPPAELLTRQVCAESGLPPGDSCPHQVPDVYLAGVSPSHKCEHLRWTWLSADARHSYCGACLPPGAIRKLVPILPPELIAYYRSTNTPYPALPPHEPSCTVTAQAAGLAITSPMNAAEYYIDKLGRKPQLALSCQAPSEVVKVHWFLNGRYLGSNSPAVQRFFQPDTGLSLLTCTDDRGRTARSSVRVHNF